MKASHKAIAYSCKNYHYAKAVPVNCNGYSVFNDANEFCGVVLFGTGANNNAGKSFGLKQGQFLELVRVALNGKHGITSKALSIAMKLVAKDNPLCKLLISYSDIDQQHHGTIYQACNWYYIGTSMQNKTDSSWIVNGKRYHGRIISNWVKEKKGLRGLTREQFIRKYYDKNAVEYITKGKHKYIYPIDKSLIPLCESLKKEYPKKQNAHEVNADKRNNPIIEIGGANPTHAL